MSKILLAGLPQPWHMLPLLHCRWLSSVSTGLGLCTQLRAPCGQNDVYKTAGSLWGCWGSPGCGGNPLLLFRCLAVPWGPPHSMAASPLLAFTEQISSRLSGTLHFFSIGVDLARPPRAGRGRPRNRWAANRMPRQGRGWEPNVLFHRESGLFLKESKGLHSLLESRRVCLGAH